jgi:translocation and assembly module TamA
LGASLASACLAVPCLAQDEVRVAVLLEGLEGELETNARAVVALARQEGEGLTPARARTLFRRAPDQIRTALEPFGRYEVAVESELLDEGEDWSARFVVDPGPATIVSRVDVALTGEGAADSGFVALADSFPIVETDTLRHAPYEAAKAEFFRYATNYGYFDARLDSAAIQVDRRTSSAVVVFHFDTGSRYRFGPITVEQDVLDSDHVDGHVTAVEGEPFDAARLRESQVALTTGPWFGRADLVVRPEEAENLAVPVTFELTPAPSQRYEVAGGYGTDTGFRGTLGVKFRRLNRRAHNAEAELRISQIETSVAGRYNVPRPFPSTAVYSAFGSFGDVSPSWSSTLVGTVGVSVSHLRGPVRETVSLAWEGSSYESAGLEGDASLMVPQIAWSWVVANDRVIATRGHRLNLTVAGAHEALFTASFVSLRLDAKAIRSVAQRSRLITRVEVGRVFTDDLLQLPPTRRFVAGGDQSVRGYAYESIGPGAAEDRLLGGNSLLAGSVEADFEVYRLWRLAVFADAGDAMNDFEGIDLAYGFGGGVRWASPLGLIRFDVAAPVSDPDRTVRLHLVIGPDL